EFLCKKGSHYYFKFTGKTIKIISSTRDTLGKNVFDRNTMERADEEFGNFDPLVRVIYKTDYDLIDNTATLLECHYLEIDRNTHQVINEINLMKLAQNPDSIITEVVVDTAEPVDIPAGGLMPKDKKDINISNDNDE
ncbi:MAG: hypothetical protein JKY84_09535, partial [Emcibacteraceae bacterium]|nr:hypothetical protein [Emcibacteraceae bacterium]